MWCTAICSWPMHTSAPFSKRSIASCQEPLKSTLYPFAGSPLKDLLYFTILYSTYRYWWILLRHNEACVCSHSRFIKQQTLFFYHLGFLRREAVQLCHQFTAFLQHITPFCHLYDGPRQVLYESVCQSHEEMVAHSLQAQRFCGDAVDT